MGNNAAYGIWEEQVVRLYDAGALDIKTLDAISEVWAYTDIDPGGSRELLTKDNLLAEEVVIKLLAPDFEPDEEDIWNKEFSDLLYGITRNRWNWR